MSVWVVACLAICGLALQLPSAVDASLSERNGHLLWVVGVPFGLWFYSTTPGGHRAHVVVTASPVDALGTLVSTSMSPSGKQFAFATNRRVVRKSGTSFLTRVALANLLTGRTRLLAQFDEPLSSPTTRVEFNDYFRGALAFSPDGQSVAFGYTAIAKPSGMTSENVVSLSVARGRTLWSISLKRVTGMEPAVLQWLPDGRLLFLASDGTVETVSPTGSGLRSVRIVVPSNTLIGGVAASPDGSELALVVDRPRYCAPEQPCTSDLYLVPATGGKAERLTRAGGSAPVWSPNGKLIAYADPAGTKWVTVATKRTTTIPLTAGGSPGLGWAVVGWLPLN